MVSRVKGLIDNVKGMTIRRVVDALALLIFYNLLFLFQNRICNGVDKPAELVSLRPQHLFQRIVGNSLKIIGSIAVGGTVCARATDPRTHLVEPTLPKILRLQKQKVFKEVSKPRRSEERRVGKECRSRW